MTHRSSLYHVLYSYFFFIIYYFLLFIFYSSFFKYFLSCYMVPSLSFVVFSCLTSFFNPACLFQVRNIKQTFECLNIHFVTWILFYHFVLPYNFMIFLLHQTSPHFSLSRFSCSLSSAPSLYLISHPVRYTSSHLPFALTRAHSGSFPHISEPHTSMLAFFGLFWNLLYLPSPFYFPL